jgi:hypothetical protein
MDNSKPQDECQARSLDGGLTVQRPDGKLATMYYFNDDPQRDRYIAATIWDPGVGGKR